MIKNITLNIFIINPVGVTTSKNTIPIIIGEMIAPSIKPNLNHKIFRGVNIFELIRDGKAEATIVHQDEYITAFKGK